MKPIEESTVCVVDHGLFAHIAQCLAKKCRRVFYTGTGERVMRVHEDDVVGDGLENIQRVESLAQVEKESDWFCFPDTGFHWEQCRLIDSGRPVFGHCGGDELETYKGRFLDTLDEVGLNVPPHTVIKGYDNLMAYLFENEDKWVKVSRYRGDWETFHWRNLEQDGEYLRGHKYNRSPFRNHFTFYVFDKIDTTIEDGIDTWCIDGQWPKTVLHAMERKDKSLIGGMMAMEDIVEDVRGVNEKFGPLLAKRYGYRGPFSTEVRIGEDSYFIDPTLRFGSPPSQLQTVLIQNLPEVMYHGAHGKCLEPEYDDPLGAQVLITSDREKEEYLSFPMKDELKGHVCSSFICQVDDCMRIAPNPLENWAGWLVATGKSVEKVVERLKELKEMLPEGFDCDITTLADLLREMEDAKKEDIHITEQETPEPSIVL